MKRKTAKEILVESFRDIAETKSVNKIAVIEIVENCGYSTTTFYRHFRDKYDLVAWDYGRRFETILSRVARDDDEWKRLCLEAALFYHDQKEYLKNLILHTNGYDSFSRNMKRIHYERLRVWLLKALDLDELDLKTEMCVRLYCQGTVDLTCDWILGKYETTVQELAEVYRTCLPYPIYKCLFVKE